MVDSGASGHNFDDAINRDLKHCFQGYVHLAALRKILTAGGAMLDGTAECVLQGLVTDNNGNQTFVRVVILVMPGTGGNLFSVMVAAKTGHCDKSSTTKTSGWRDSMSPCHYGAREASSIHSC